MADEIRMANVLLESIDGGSPRSFAYPCGDRTAGDSSYLEEVRRLFPCARGVEGKLQTLDEIDPYDVGACMIVKKTAEEMIGLVERAAARKALLVFLFHGVGGGHAIDVPASSHRALLAYLKSREGVVWVAPLREVIEFVRETRAEVWRSQGQ
jgi:sialate O-acetylesterase